ncbi:MAG: SdiA-regulated domain-containing protein [Saprospiraceae bacterium]
MLIYLCFVWSALPTLHDSIPYNLSEPSRSIALAQPELYEISGLSPLPMPGKLLAIGDEKGECYILDAHTGDIERRIPFRDKGDFEGVEWHGPCLFAVKSDGTLYEISKWENAKRKVFAYNTPLTKNNDVEGLCYDPKRHALLLACKEDKSNPKPRGIYAFDLKTKRLADTAAYVIDVEALQLRLPKDKGNYFSPSGIAIHPLTGDIYVISTAKKALLTLDYDSGAVKHIQALDPRIFAQPEGIAFMPDGVMYISNEGRDRDIPATILRFDLRQPATRE